MKKKIYLAVTNFALPAPRRGSIDNYTGFLDGQALGIQIHQEIQQQRSKLNPSYEAEVPCTHKFTCDNYIFEVSGKMDGIYHTKKFKIEEIKTAFELGKLFNYIKNNEDNHPYCLQLKTYAYIHWLRTKEIPELNLHLVSSRNRKYIDYNLIFDVDSYEHWLAIRLQELVAEVKLMEKKIKQRKKAATSLLFPFAVTRSGQKELMQSVEDGMKSNQPMLIQAPTGLGKTIGILHPALIESMNRGQKTIYLTPKNSQHLAAEDAVKHIQSKGGNIKSLTLSAKRKICMKEETICNPEYCEFAENHYTKVAENNLLEKLRKEKRLTLNSFKKVAEEYKVCPYELQMDMVSTVETVICDYNYAFSPHHSVSRVSKINVGEIEKPNVIIDEAHNLPVRGMDYYSSALSVFVLEKIGKAYEAIPVKFHGNFKALLEECISIIKNSGEPNNKVPHLIIPPVKIIVAQEVLLRDFLLKYLESDVVITSNDIVMQLFNYWTEFTFALEWITSGKKEFFASYNPQSLEIRITCCNAGEMLQPRYLEYAQVIAFSATLKPFDFYSQLMGIPSKKLKSEEFVSPFPKDRRKIIIIPQLSSKFSERQRNYSRIAEAVQKISSVKQGNYFVFFPSFDFLDKVFEIFTPAIGFKTLRQSRGMHQNEINQLLKALRDESSAHIIFAVQGGIFSEGVDYPGNLAIGAFVVGTALPSFNWEREKMKEYYEQQYSAGINYAYTYPAMAKAVQSAGRVIRSETDKGIIVLMDNRFLHSNYSKCMPQDWFNVDPKEMVSQSILEEVKQFWVGE